MLDKKLKNQQQKENWKLTDAANISAKLKTKNMHTKQQKYGHIREIGLNFEMDL